MKRVKEIFVVIIVVSFTSLGGIALGGLTNTLISSNSSIVYASCEEDECEGGSDCKDNVGQDTKCSMSGNNCTTGACDDGWISWF